MSGTSTSDRTRIWTPSNIITIIRILLVPIFVVALLSPWPAWFGIHDLISNEVKSIIAAAIFVLISATDWLDGYLARSRNEVTDFGKFADPLADKILVIAALLALIELQVLPSWPVLIIIVREFIVSGIRMLAATKGEVIAASWYGKAKTVTQIIAIVLFLIKDSFHIPSDVAIQDPLYLISWIVMLVALALTILSMIDYITKAWPILSGKTSQTCDLTDRAPSSDAVDEVAETVCYTIPHAGQIHILAEKVIGEYCAKNLTIATAESLTGGMISEVLTGVAGSSSVVLGGVVSYVNSVKHHVLGVSEHLLERDGAVNSQTALQMAKGVASKFDVDVAISVTGIAGPTGAEPGKPVGTVFMGIYDRGVCSVKEFHFKGYRDEVRIATTKAALNEMLDISAEV